MQVFSTSTYERAKEMEDSIVAAPDAAPVIRGTGGIRKLRWAGSGRGKRGGIRVVFYQAGPDVIYLLTACAKADREDLTPADSKALTRLVAAIKKELQGKVTMQRTDLGCEIETALGEVLAHVRGETGLSCRIVDDPAASRIVALRKRLRLSRQKFADRFGLDVRAVQEWEQGRRVPDRAARVLLTVIDRDPEAVVRALGEDGGDGRSGDSSEL